MQIERRELIKLFIGVISAHLLLNFTYKDEDVFWYMFTASSLVLISYAILNSRVEDKLSPALFLAYGVASGLLLFGVFYLGYFVLEALDSASVRDVAKLYRDYAPNNIWQYLALILFVVPGEEIFWRGYVFSKLKKQSNLIYSIMASSLLYASVQIYAEAWILVVAAIGAGIYWNILYHWKKSMPLLIVSHLTFDLLLFWYLPV
ncbi:MAG TPA: CPBP family intramembrane glutamic endopeptidase [Bacillus sp. (in: firmicutes)]|uniref:CPBP family intramembrane glutamic endopeptidase n=1 Tax=Bacillus litorisediminis TaxID=2922713 RepID=UPI001FAE2FC1|nr:CPBP family intramembrane glutamic endopeptidase [Bacillus litorisediminis]HWO74897.1 CPBP family intramembrane glutamic endopeptidase [Bacillus sp. (in: firmicutes)]